MGLSPLTRGNLPPPIAPGAEKGPIPAHAGEPAIDISYRPIKRAYPRSRGGTLITSRPGTCGPGLSPLTRGNPSKQNADYHGKGPIPAHAGEPGAPEPLSGSAGAYPRSRGGTSAVAIRCAKDMGLSPLTRGNLNPMFSRSMNIGPIPAHAGEPMLKSVGHWPCWAYPRSRGGTVFATPCASWIWGLSPLTRGNHTI